MVATMDVFVLALCLLSGVQQALSEGEDDKLIVTSIQEPPFLMPGDEPDTFKGFIPEMIEHLAQEMDFEYELQKVPDGRYGAEVRETWSGMVGELVKGRADIAAGPLTMSDARKEVIDFTEPFMEMGITLLVQKPSNRTDGVKPVQSVADLANRTDIRFGMVRGGHTEAFFKNSQDDVYKKIWQKTEDRNLLTSISDGVGQVRDGDGSYVFLIESPMADYWTNQPPCNLMTVGDNLNENGYALATQKDAELTEGLSAAVQAMVDSGAMQELRDKWWSVECSGASVPAGRTVALGVLAVMVAMVTAL